MTRPTNPRRPSPLTAGAPGGLRLSGRIRGTARAAVEAAAILLFLAGLRAVLIGIGG